MGPSILCRSPVVAIDDTHREVFEKTLGLYATLLTRGCHGFSGELELTESDSEMEIEENTYCLPLDSRSHVRPECNGQIQLQFNTDGSPFVK